MKYKGVYYKGVWKDEKGNYDKNKYSNYHYHNIGNFWKHLCHNYAYGIEISESKMTIKKVIDGRVITKMIRLNDDFLYSTSVVLTLTVFSFISL